MRGTQPIIRVRRTNLYGDAFDAFRELTVEDTTSLRTGCAACNAWVPCLSPQSASRSILPPPTLTTPLRGCRFRVEFVNAEGQMEAGIDGGGLFKELLDTVCKEAFDPEHGFWMVRARAIHGRPHV